MFTAKLFKTEGVEDRKIFDTWKAAYGWVSSEGLAAVNKIARAEIYEGVDLVWSHTKTVEQQNEEALRSAAHFLARL